MGLDAVVYCDCFELGRLKESPPPGCRLAVARDGSLLCGSDDLQVQLAFDEWHFDRACEHENGILVHHYIGNIALVAALRAALAEMPEEFPLILSQVLYSGTHCGDFIAAHDVPDVQAEVEVLAEVHSKNPDIEEALRDFHSQMAELTECAVRVGKPIAF